jgi:hypothetical protein
MTPMARIGLAATARDVPGDTDTLRIISDRKRAIAAPHWCGDRDREENMS